MIAYLKGEVLSLEPKHIVLLTAGVGYRVAVGREFKDNLTVSQEVELYIYHHMSDSAQTLFGFAKKEDLEYFELLLSVPSVGPRTAMSVLDAIPMNVLSHAIHENDVSLLPKVSGVGRKTAQRIVVELKGKVAFVSGVSVRLMSAKLQEEVVEVLVAMGVKLSQAKVVVSKLPPDIQTVEEAVKAALRSQ